MSNVQRAKLQLLSAGIGVIMIWLAVVGGVIGGLLTHIVVCIQTSQWLLLIAGAILPPIGIVHGIGYLFGYFH